MTFILTFSVLIDGMRVPLIEDGKEVTLTIEADSKTSAIEKQEVKDFCVLKGNDCRVRRII